MVNYTPNLEDTEFNQFESSIETIMDKKFLWFQMDLGIDEAIDKMVKENVTGAPVLDEDMRLVGYLSQKDCLKLATQMRYLNDLPRNVEDYMSRDLYSVHYKTSIFHVIQSFIDKWFHVYPVTNDRGQVIGVISRNKMLGYVNQQSQTKWRKKKSSWLKAS